MNARARILISACVVLLLATPVSFTQGRGDGSGVISPGSSVQQALTQLARSRRVLLGFESTDQKKEIVGIKAPLSISNIDIRDAIDSIVKGHPYRVSVDRGVFLVRTTQPGLDGKTVLEREVTNLDLLDQTLSDVAGRIREVFVPNLKTSQPPRVGLPPLAQRRFSLSSSKPITVADILTGAVIAHGAGGWTLSFSTALDGNTGLYSPSVGVFTFDGFQMDVSIPRQFLARRD